MKRDREEALTLEILQVIDGSSDVTQRHLADKTGIALGLANSFLRRCARKGLIKITQAPANRYLYYLTPKGFAEKSRLTAEYFTSSFSFYRTASESIAKSLRFCADRSRNRVVFSGTSELAEIGFVRAHDFGIEVLGLFEPQTSSATFVGKPVWTTIEELPSVDAMIFTGLVEAPLRYETLIAKLPQEFIVVPDIVQQMLPQGPGT
tara:strand:- start:730 stop:1347 length:618 start_codon:yes stop_codon:yes gene_type:complete